jgi:hypothetical protein
MKLPELIVLASTLAKTTLNAQTSQSFHRTISNLGTEPAPYIPPVRPQVIELTAARATGTTRPPVSQLYVVLKKQVLDAPSTRSSRHAGFPAICH